MKHHRKLLLAELSLYGHQNIRGTLVKECADLNTELQGLKKSSKTQMDRSKEIHNRLEEIVVKMKNTTRNMAPHEATLREIDENSRTRMEALSEEIRRGMQREHRGMVPVSRDITLLKCYRTLG